MIVWSDSPAITQAEEPHPIIFHQAEVPFWEIQFAGGLGYPLNWATQTELPLCIAVPRPSKGKESP